MAVLTRTTRIGDGSEPQELDRFRFDSPALNVLSATDRIDRPTDWSIYDSRHTFVIHLGGRMDELETKLEGHGGCVGPATPGEVWNVPAGRNYASHARGTWIQYVVFSVSADALDSLDGTDSGSVDVRPVAGVRDDTLHRSALSLIRSLSDDDDVSRMEVESQCESLTRYLLESYRLDQMPRERRHPLLSDAMAETIREFIFDNMSSRIELGAMAQVAGMTVHHFLIAFRKVFGVTPTQYLIEQRVRQAKWLLLHTRMDITEIALATGFASHSHLTSAFRSRIGTPPSEFRRRFKA